VARLGGHNGAQPREGKQQEKEEARGRSEEEEKDRERERERERREREVPESDRSGPLPPGWLTAALRLSLFLSPSPSILPGRPSSLSLSTRLVSSCNKRRRGQWVPGTSAPSAKAAARPRCAQLGNTIIHSAPRTPKLPNRALASLLSRDIPRYERALYASERVLFRVGRSRSTRASQLEAISRARLAGEIDDKFALATNPRAFRQVSSATTRGDPGASTKGHCLTGRQHIVDPVSLSNRVKKLMEDSFDILNESLSRSR